MLKFEEVTVSYFNSSTYEYPSEFVRTVLHQWNEFDNTWLVA
jgi:hypothetical protein